MGHNVGDAAKAAVQRSETKAVMKLTPEQLIQALRSNLRANPPVGAYVPNHQIQALLVAYDAEKEFSHKLAEDAFAAKESVKRLLVEKQTMVETILGLTFAVQKLQANTTQTGNTQPVYGEGEFAAPEAAE